MPNVKWKFVVVLPFYGIGRVTIMHVCVHMCKHIIICVWVGHKWEIEL